jgi:hypothetical protein
MIGRLAGLRGTLSSHWLASAVAGAYLVLSLILGVALLSMPKEPGPAASPAASIPTIVYEDSPTEAPQSSPEDRDDSGTTGSPTTSTTTTTIPPSKPAFLAPDGYQEVNGPAGLRTVIPVGWRAMKTTGPGAMQATDPADTIRYVKYGGSPAPTLGIESSHIQYENGFAARAVDYRRITLSSANYDGHDAVEWEFEHRDGANLMHVRSLYWRADGKEYFVLAAAPTTRWPQMQPIYEAMVANSTP